MSDFTVIIESGESIKLPIAGKVSDNDIIVTAQGGGGSGTAPEDLDAELTTQEELIEQLRTTLQGKAAGEGALELLNAVLSSTVTEITSYVDKIGSYKFNNCDALVRASFPNAMSLGQYAFNDCGKLTEIYAPNVTSLGTYVFQNCVGLTDADFPLATSIPTNALYQCKKLKTINFPNATSVGTNAMRTCSVLGAINLPKVTSIASYAFGAAAVMKTADLGAVTSIGANAFNACYRLHTLIMRGDGIATLSNTSAFTSCYWLKGAYHKTYNPNTEQGYVYVPRAYLSDEDETMDYRRATNWTTLPEAAFRALEDYTVDGTITGELDPDKI